MSEYIEFKDRLCTARCVDVSDIFVFHNKRLVLNFSIFYSIPFRHVCVFCTPVSEIFDVK